MQLRQGIDLVSVPRIQQLIKKQGKSFLNRVFTPLEQAYCDGKFRRFEHYAARFAAKEAFIKAVGLEAKHGLIFRDLEVRRHPSGKPFLVVSSKLKKKLRLNSTQIEISLAHDGELAVATVLLI